MEVILGLENWVLAHLHTPESPLKRGLDKKIPSREGRLGESGCVPSGDLS
jgi:hypothetical protein